MSPRRFPRLLVGRRALDRLLCLCLACGDEFQKGDAVLQQAQVGFTHARCGEWWRDYDLTGVQLPQDDDIPF
jgi:hypothetical protein